MYILEDGGDYFVDNYFKSKSQFLKKANYALTQREGELLHWELECSADFRTQNKGDHSISCDSLWLGDNKAEKVLVFISGTHGVEGFCGSAAQQFLLDQVINQKLLLPKDCALLLIHALNPWGMVWARRCDHQGIDINRNFIDFAQAPLVPFEYTEVLSCLQLTGAPERKIALLELQKKWGQVHFDHVFSGGQYQHSWAPFYGGQEPSFSYRVVDKIIKKYSLPDKELIVIDIHTGLGPWAYGQLISDHPTLSQNNDFAKKIFSEWVGITAAGGSFSVEKAGLMDYHWHKLMNRGRGCFLTLEFGTLGTDSLFSTLLDEHLFWKNKINVSETDVQYQKQRYAMLQHFCPKNLQWQQAVLFQTWQVFNRIMSSAI